MLKVALCDPASVAKTLIANLGYSNTVNGDRLSPYHAIAWVSGDSEARTVSVSLTENIAGVEDSPYYSIHVIDDITGKSCDLYDTEDQEEQSLIDCLKKIGAGLPEEIEEVEPSLQGESYKVKQIEAMIAGESIEGEVHYGAHLSYWRGGANPINLDVGALLVLRDYYLSHKVEEG